MMQPMICILTSPHLQIPWGVLDFLFQSWDPILFGSLYGWNNFLWLPNPIDSFYVSLFVHLDRHYLVILFIQERYGLLDFLFTLFVGIGEDGCFLCLFSSILHIALIGLIAFLVVCEANHGFTLIKLLHSLGGDVLMRLN